MLQIYPFPKYFLIRILQKSSWQKKHFMAKDFDTSTNITALYSLQDLKSDKHTLF